VLTLSDPGPGQILGLRTAASDILTSFSASYDYGQAGRQCLLLTALVLLLATPLAIATAPRLADEILVCQTRPRGRLLPGGLAWATCGGVLLVAAFVLAPAAGLVLPIQGGDLGRASRELARTGLNTLWYATGAGATAAAIGLGLALCVGRNGRLRMVVLGASLVMFSLPPVLTALGVAWTASHSPAWADVVLRSRLTVCVALGLRSLPVATLLGLRAWGSLPATWAAAAAIHGVSTSRYLGRVVAPCLLPSAVIAVLIVALLATADVGTVLLLHPPGEGSLPLTIFTVMANAPESLVAALCLAYVGLAVALLAVAWTVAQRGKP
jgi:ABC-type Fe3+ transport system permease subunit